MLYVCEEPWQTEAFPEIEPGAAGVVRPETLNVLALLVPQELEAVTEIFPLVDPAVTEMEVEAEVPDHPEGKVQL
jgi:hypothetical protein